MAVSANAIGPTSRPIFHLHPLSRCNLACRHCYSESSPKASSFLTRDQALGALAQAARWGYKRLSISGGEPLLYPWLRDILIAAKELGLATSVVSNGMLIDRPGAIDALRCADIVSLSVDGMAATHDAVRGQEGAFSRVKASMDRLSDAGISFGVSCGVGPANVGEMDAIAAFVHSAGASLLQFHPLEASGRAQSSHEELVLDDESMTYFFVLATVVCAEYVGRMTIRSDVVHREVAIAHPHLVYAHHYDPRSWEGALPSDLLGVLVMTSTGMMMPVTYGVPKDLWIGNGLQHDCDSTWCEYVNHRYAQLRKVGKIAFDRIVAGTGPEVFNPSELLSRTAWLQVQAYRSSY